MKCLAPAATCLLALALCPAQAALRLCNRTSYVIYAATGVVDAGGTDVKGWTRVVPGACAVAIDGDLAAQGYLVFARSSRAHTGAPRAWSGPATLCIKDRDFRLHLVPGAPRCSGDAYETGFAPIATHHMRSWTTTFREAPDLPSMPAAERAGLKRLLGDLGIRNLANDKAVDAALAQLRGRARLPQTADASALFGALETDAMRNVAPAGYTVCNDTAKPVYAAVAQTKGAGFVSRGWWTVGAGSCSQVIADSVAGAPVWLRVERAQGAALVAGSMTFCVTNIAFEVQGRERCAARGLVESGFAETNVNRAAGYAAHVTPNGLK